MNISSTDNPLMESIERPVGLWTLYGFLLLLATVLLRSWDLLSHPSLFVEDTLLFTRYYGNTKPFLDVADNHLGQPYITLIVNFFAWLYAHADVRLQPLLYQWTGFVFAMVAALCLFVSGLIRSRTILLCGPLLMGLTAINHIYYYNTLIYQMYTGVAIVLALMFFPPPRQALVRLLFLCLFIVLPWSGPYSVVVIPASLALMLFFRGSSFRYVLLLSGLFSTVLYFLTVEGNTTKLVHLTKWGVLRHYSEVLLEQVVFLGQFDHVSNWYWIPVLGVIGSCFYLLRQDLRYIKHSLVFFGIIVASLALFFLSIKFPLYLHTSACHRFLSLFFWCFFLLYSTDRLLLRYGSTPLLSGVIAAMLVLIIVHDNRRYPRKHFVEPIPLTAPFLEAVNKLEQLELQEKGEYVVLKLHNYQTPFFEPRATVGSRSEHARQVDAHELPPGDWKQFIQEKK